MSTSTSAVHIMYNDSSRFVWAYDQLWTVEPWLVCYRETIIRLPLSNSGLPFFYTYNRHTKMSNLNTHYVRQVLLPISLGSPPTPSIMSRELHASVESQKGLTISGEPNTTGREPFEDDSRVGSLGTGNTQHLSGGISGGQSQGLQSGTGGIGGAGQGFGSEGEGYKGVAPGAAEAHGVCPSPLTMSLASPCTPACHQCRWSGLIDSSAVTVTATATNTATTTPPEPVPVRALLSVLL